MHSSPPPIELMPPLRVIDDALQPCPYLPGREARMPLGWALEPVSPATIDRLLEQGYRRSGPFLYRTACPACQACEPTRLDVKQFRSRGSLRRVEKRGDGVLRIEAGPPVVDSRRVELFNRHRLERGLDQEGQPLDAAAYHQFLVETCCQTRELSFWYGDQLAAIAVLDLGRTSFSAVYTFFRPDWKRLSLGTYAILKSIAWGRAEGYHWYYLGFYVADNPHLNYKRRFLPQQRKRLGRWEWETGAGSTA
jgi:arginine-tRNA-protein transferase